MALQTAVAMEAPVAGCPEAALAEDALKEALACPSGSVAKALHAGLLKLAAGLGLQGASQVSRRLSCPLQSFPGRGASVGCTKCRVSASPACSCSRKRRREWQGQRLGCAGGGEEAAGAG